MRKLLSILLLTALLLTTLSLGACKKEEPEEEKVMLNIIDDNYRNWYEIFVHSFYDTKSCRLCPAKEQGLPFTFVLIPCIAKLPSL